MKIKTIILMAMLCPCLAQAQLVPISPPNPPKDLNLGFIPPTLPSSTNSQGLQFTDITLANLLKILFSEVITKNYALSPEVLIDERFISFRFNKDKNGNIESFLSNYLFTLGYEMSLKNNVYYVEKIGKKKIEDFKFIVYKPNYRTANYLMSNTRNLFPENFSNTSRPIANLDPANSFNKDDGSNTSANAMVQKEEDYIIIKYETEKQKDQILNLLTVLDTKEDEFVIKAYIYEVTLTDNQADAFSLIVNLFNGKFSAGINPVSSLDNFLKLTIGGIQLVTNNLQTDSRFKLLSSPALRVKSGESATLNSGQEVPTLGNVSYQGASGTPVQSIVYKNSGILFQVTPKSKQKIIDVDFSQQVSDFQKTTTGLNNTPTLTKRELKTKFTISSGETIFIGGLKQVKENNAKNTNSFIPFFKGESKENSTTEVVVFLSIEPI